MHDINDPRVAKIAKLLRMAERASTPEEADAFMTKAQALSTEHSIDLAIARQHTAKTEKIRTPESRTVRIGKRGQRGLFTLVNLGVAIGRANDTRVAVAHDSTHLYFYGFSEDIDMCVTLLEFLQPQMSRDFLRYKESWEYQNMSRWQSGITLRLSFQEGWVNGVGTKLWYAAKTAKHEAIAKDVTQGTGTELAIRNKEIAVSDYYKKYSGTGKRSYRGGRNFEPNGRAYSQGREDGNNARITGNKSIAATSYSRGAI